MARVILLEFNELCPRLLDGWMAAGYLPNFKKFHDQSEVFVTEADETDPVNLEPWIQWYSVHTGLPYREHRVFHLTDGPRAGHPDVWRILNENGKRAWNCSSMNARGFSFSGSAFLPDPWCTTENAFPPELEIFRRFTSRHVQEYTNKETVSITQDTVAFLWFMAMHGLRLTTASAIARQLASEFATSGRTRWRRVSLLDKLQFDVFRHFFRHIKPDFSSFFINSTAHLQHAYWRHMEPEAFAVRPSPEEADRYGNAILFGYREMDWLLGEFLALAEGDAQLILATALSQQPYTKYESIGGHHFYRANDIAGLLAMLGISAEKVLPVMTHQYMAHFEDEAKAAEAKAQLNNLVCDGQAVFGFDPSEPRTLYFGNQVHTAVAPGSRVQLKGDPAARSFDFHELFYGIDEIKSGRHHADGCLWIRTGKHRRHDEKASILDILPTILDLYGLPTGGFAGKPLLS